MKTATLSLHHLTAMDVSAYELVSLAAQAGCQDVCLFTYMPERFRAKYPLVEGSEVQHLAREMRRLSVGCLSLEVFPLTVDTDFVEMERSLEIGASLGARYATVHSHIEDQQQARDRLGTLGEISGDYAIGLAVEFNPFSRVTTLAQALHLIEPFENGRVGLVLDTLHAGRGGAQSAAIDASQQYIDFVQISDAPAAIDQSERWKEAMLNRMVPGAGELPLIQMLSCLKSDLKISIEVPQNTVGSSSSDAKSRVLRAVDGARKTLWAAGFKSRG